MKLYIAEKPSLGKIVAKGLGGGQPGDGCINGNGWIVTWAFGHLYEQAEPDINRAGNYIGTWQVPEVHSDAEGRCLSQATADAVAEKINNKPGQVIDFQSKKKEQLASLPFSLADLQAYASKKWGMSAQQVLDVCQANYEKHKIQSYPRTDCNYLADGQLADIQSIFKALETLSEAWKDDVVKANAALKPRCFNDSKLTAHTAIIPTGQKPDTSAMSLDEKRIYDAVARRYLAQFYPAHEYEQTVIVTEIEKETFKTTGKVTFAPGWKVLYGTEDLDEKPSEDDQQLPKLNQCDQVQCVDTQRLDQKTHPTKHFTEGTLIKAMANIVRFLPADTDSEIKKRLKETDGLGTEATRSSIIETLKRRDFLTVKGKKILSTDTGRSVVDALPGDITSPALTALWEQSLKSIAENKMGLNDFEARQKDWVVKLVEDAKKLTVSISSTKPAKENINPCPSCGKPMIRRKSTHGFFWGCSGFPDCKTTMPDSRGKPGKKGTGSRKKYRKRA